MPSDVNESQKTLRVAIVVAALFLGWVVFVNKGCMEAKHEASVRIAEKTGCPPWRLQE